MTTEQYRENLSAWIDNFRLSHSIGTISAHIDIQFLIDSLSNGKFGKEASVDDLYKFRGEILKLYSKTKHIADDIQEKGFLFWGQFEDQIMNFDELGIKTKLFECVNAFDDDFSYLHILPGTIFEVEELLYPNAGNMITGTYQKLVTDTESKKLVEAFENGQRVILNLKILEESFEPIPDKN